ncbi:hypothetical protein HZ326_27453 [Fusarium oxysporum f. sp. albedinis]|nr:hypothetical protein HZ326_27453 [Fusarium oxysporum f. sp. albedinis]
MPEMPNASKKLFLCDNRELAACTTAHSLLVLRKLMLLDWRQFGLDWICRKIAGLDLGFSKIWTGLD